MQAANLIAQCPKLHVQRVFYYSVGGGCSCNYMWATIFVRIG